MGKEGGGSTLFTHLTQLKNYWKLKDIVWQYKQKTERKKHEYQKQGTFKTEVSNFTVLVLNQSSISAVPLIVRCHRDQKTALMGDSLYLGCNYAMVNF